MNVAPIPLQRVMTTVAITFCAGG